MGAWGRVRTRPRPRPRLSSSKPSCGLSATWARPPPECLSPARSSALCPSWVQGSRGTPPRSRHRDPPLDGRWSGRRPNPERPERLPPPHAAALTRPCSRPGAHPCGLEKLAGSNPEPATPRPAHTIAPPPGGGSRAALPAQRPRRRAAPAPGHPPGSCRLSDPRGCAGGAGRRGGGAERGWAARAPPPPRPGQWKAPAAEGSEWPRGGLCRSLLPLAGRRLVAGVGDS